MSLPQDFKTPEEYLQECTQFLKEYQFLYNFANTDILVLDILDQITMHEENLKDLTVFEDNFSLAENKNEDVFLSIFFDKLQKFKADFLEMVEDQSLENKLDCPLSSKKKHEIVYLVRKIKEVLSSKSCNTVVDFGSGLGYFDQLLFETTNLNVLGLECDEGFYVEAKKRQKKYHSSSVDRVKYKRHKVTENSIIDIEEYLQDKFPNQSRFCIAGLHACADLTVTAINIFLKMADAKTMVIVPCCYHRMVCAESSFKNFPLSECFKTIAEKENYRQFMTIPLLRLAAQPPSLMDSLDKRVFNLLSRAVLQLYAHKNKLTLKRKKRKAVRLKTKQNDFEKYIEEAKEGFNVETETVGGNNPATLDLDELRKIWQALPETVFKKVSIFILLQDELQPVIENMILYDRLLYLRENGIKDCRYEKIFNPIVSPRCLALIANK